MPPFYSLRPWIRTAKGLTDVPRREKKKQGAKGARHVPCKMEETINEMFEMIVYYTTVLCICCRFECDFREHQFIGRGPSQLGERLCLCVWVRGEGRRWETQKSDISIAENYDYDLIAAWPIYETSGKSSLSTVG